MPRAGVLVIPPQMEPRELNTESFNTFAAKKYAANIGTKLNYSSSSAPLPMLIKAGVQNDFAFGEKFGLQIGLGAGYLAQSPNKAVVVDAGADFRMFDMFSLRAGYHYSTDVKAAPSYMSAGLGFDISMISLSAAYLIASGPVSGTLCATIGVRF